MMKALNWLRSFGRKQPERVEADPQLLSLTLISSVLHHMGMLDQRARVAISDDAAAGLFRELVGFYFALFSFTVVDRYASDVTRNAYGAALLDEMRNAIEAQPNVPAAWSRVLSADEFGPLFDFYYRDELTDADQQEVTRILRHHGGGDTNRCCI